MVLYRTTMPGILVETGFITNSRDEAFLKSDDGQAYLASAIYRAVKSFKEEAERPDNKAAIAQGADEAAPDSDPSDIRFRVQFLSRKHQNPWIQRNSKDWRTCANTTRMGCTSIRPGTALLTRQRKNCNGISGKT